MSDRMSDERFETMARWRGIDPDTDFDRTWYELRDALAAERAAYDELLNAATAVVNDRGGLRVVTPFDALRASIERSTR